MDSRRAAALLALVLLALALSGIGPRDRLTWLLEVSPVLIGAPLLVLTWRRFPLTPLTCSLLALHALPDREVARALSGALSSRARARRSEVVLSAQ